MTITYDPALDGCAAEDVVVEAIEVEPRFTGSRRRRPEWST